jgi:hypothetical protein
MTMTLQQVIDERMISFLKEQINYNNKAWLNSAFQLQIDTIRSVDDFELIELLILQRKKSTQKLQIYPEI